MGRIFTFLILYILFIVPASIAQEGKYSCIFMDTETGERLKGVEMQIFMPHTMGHITLLSDNNGVVSFEIEQPFVYGATYSIRFFKEGYVNPSGYLRLVEPFQRTYQLRKLPVPKVTEQAVIVKNQESEEAVPSMEGFAENNFVFLIDVSASMGESDRLPVLKESLKYLVNMYRPTDRVAVVTYSSGATVRLNSTPASQKERIMEVVNTLEASGSSQGGKGLNLAYSIALDNLIEDGNNRIILATDGAFVSDDKEWKLIREVVERGLENDVALSVLSFGRIDDSLKERMSEMAETGQGTYAHLTSDSQAREILVREAQGKVQVTK